MSIKKKNKMVIVLDGENNIVATCSPAQARILKKEGIARNVSIEKEGFIFAIKLNKGYEFLSKNSTQKEN